MTASFRNFNWVTLVEGIIFAPRATAVAFAQADGLNSKAWILVISVGFFSLFLDLLELFFASLVGYQDYAVDSVFAIIGLIFGVATFPIQKWIYSWVLRMFGNETEIRDVTSLAALGHGTNIWLMPLLTLAVVVLTLLAQDKPAVYESAGLYLIIPYLFGSCLLIAYYIDGLFDGGIVRSFFVSTITTVLNLIMILSIIFVFAFTLGAIIGE